MGYEFTSRIRYSECGQSQTLTFDHLVDYFQDCSVFHEMSVGLGTLYWKKKQQMWVLTSWKILIFDRPKCGDLVTVRTDAIECKGFRGLRNFTMRSEDGRLLAAAYTRWALMSLIDGRPARLTPEESEAYGRTEPLPMEMDSRKITVPEDAVQGEAIEVMPFFLDTNHHMNNAQYIKVLQDLVPQGFQICTLKMSYHKQAVLGDLMYPRISRANDTIQGALETADGEPYVLFEFKDCFSETDKKVAFL